MRKIRILVLLLAVPLLWVSTIACSTKRDTALLCRSNQDCSAGEVCYASKCVRILGGVDSGNQVDSAPPTCDATTCPNGCCDGTGVCQPPSEQTCGISGVSCSICAVGQSCVAGSCQAKDNPKCDATTCSNGCCDASGICQASSDIACGVGGGRCYNCQAANNICQAGICVTKGTKPPGCDATTCPNGCCNAAGICQVNTDTICGREGGACYNCQAANNICQLGVCVPKGTKPPTCDATTCADGCCDTAGSCQRKNTKACGTGGGVCSICPSGTHCSATGVCEVPTQKCDASTCADGCCSSDGICQRIQGDSTCGAGGTICNDCASIGNVCNPTTKACQAPTPTCGSANCGGCCDANGQCIASPTTQQCGKGGAACSACSSGYTCNVGVCQPPASSYPAGPYGSGIGNTLTNLSIPKCGTNGSFTAAKDMFKKYKVHLIMFSTGAG